MKIADRIKENLNDLALVETWDNGKALRETKAADLPLTIDHFRYFGSVIRAETGEVSDLDSTRVTQKIHEPLGVRFMAVSTLFSDDELIELNASEHLISS